MAKVFANSFLKNPVKFALGAVIDMGGLLALLAYIFNAL